MSRNTRYDFKPYHGVSGVYIIRNIKKARTCYIGCSGNVGKRWGQHLNDLAGNKHHSKFLQRAYNKYGKENFIFSLVEVCSAKEIFDVEQKHLNSTKSLYNVCRTAGSASTLGKPKSKSHVMKLSRPVVAFDDLGKKVLEFYSAAEAQRCGYNNISRAIKDKHKIKGLIWNYRDVRFDLKTWRNSRKKQYYPSNECLDNETGIYYDSLTEAAKALTKQSFSTFVNKLRRGDYSKRLQVFVHNKHKNYFHPNSIPYLDTETGIFYDSRSEMVMAVGIDPMNCRYHLEYGNYGNRFLRLD